MSYKYENPTKLIIKIMNYIKDAKVNGVLAIEEDVKKEKNLFLKLVLNDILDGFSPDDLGHHKIFIKYYVKELDCSKNKKYKIKKQLKMILFALTLFAQEETFHKIKINIESFYPRFK